MDKFMQDFLIFFSTILAAITDFWLWFSGTIIGQIILFTLMISMFLWVIKLIIDLKE